MRGLSRRDLIKRLRNLAVLSISGSVVFPLVTWSQNEAKACAAAIVANITGANMPDPIFMAVFYGLIGKRYAISNVNVYQFRDGLIKNTSGGLSSSRVSDIVRYKEVIYAEAWYKSMTSDTFG